MALHPDDLQHYVRSLNHRRGTGQPYKIEVRLGSAPMGSTVGILAAPWPCAMPTRPYRLLGRHRH